MTNSMKHCCYQNNFLGTKGEKDHNCINKDISMNKRDGMNLSVYVESGFIGMACKVWSN